MLSDPVLLAIVAAIPPLALGLFGLVKSAKKDKQGQEFTSIGLIVDGLNKLLNEVQEDNAVLREELRELRLAGAPKVTAALQEAAAATAEATAAAAHAADAVVAAVEDVAARSEN